MLDVEERFGRASRAMASSFGVIIGVFCAALLLPLAERYEGRIHPVVDDFETTSLVRTSSGIEIAGTMRKRRDCGFVGLSLYVGDPDDPASPRERLAVRFLDHSASAGSTREPGRQPWGPWRIDLPRSVTGPKVFMAVTHECHLLFRTRGVYWETDALELFGARQDDAGRF